MTDEVECLQTELDKYKQSVETLVKTLEHERQIRQRMEADRAAVGEQRVDMRRLSRVNLSQKAELADLTERKKEVKDLAVRLREERDRWKGCFETACELSVSGDWTTPQEVYNAAAKIHNEKEGEKNGNVQKAGVGNQGVVDRQ